MRQALLLIWLFLLTGVATAQTVESRNNFTGLWSHRSAWLQEWTGRQNTNPLPVTAINQYGYLSRGTSSAPANILLSGTGSVLRVYDTLRVHGSMAVVNYAHLVVESTGVLIVHGNYDQYDWGKLTIYGKMVVLGDLKLYGSTQRSENFGRLYVGGSSNTGGWPLNQRTLAQLASEDVLTAYFSTIQVVASFCPGNNSGTLTVTLPSANARVVRWQSSTDYFKANVTNIQNSNTAQLSFSNLNRTTSYRAFINYGDGTSGYSNGATIFIESATLAGTISGQSDVCSFASSVPLELKNNTGEVVRWEWSYDNFATAPQTLVTSSSSFTLSNVSATTYVRTVVGGCGEVTTPVFTVNVTPGRAEGEFEGPAAVCVGGNTGTITLKNATGSVVRWESSVDGFKTHTAITHRDLTLTFNNLSQNTSYRAVINDGGVCAESFTSIVEVKVVQNLTEGSLAAAETPVPVDQLLAQYTFMKNAMDASASGNHGIVSGASAAADRFGRLNSAYSFDGVDDYITTTHKFAAPGINVFSLSLWFKTSSTVGGKLIGAGGSQLGSSINYDRHLYLSNNGQLHFGVFRADLAPAQHKLLSTTASYNDGAWHHVVASLSATGMKLYVDGVLQGADPAVTSAEEFAGFWRMGYDNLNGWPNQPGSNYFNGSLDDVYIYGRELSAEEINQLFMLNVGPFCLGQDVQLRAVTVPGGSYTWTGPAGFTSSQQNPLISSFASAQAGTYSVSVKLGGCEYAGQAVLSAPAAGTVTASINKVCYGTNSGSLSLSAFEGTIVRWESSTDNFQTEIVAISNLTTELAFSDLAATTSYRAVVKYSPCSAQYSATATVEVISQSQGGSISGTASVCKGINSGTLTLADYTGSIQHWEYSDDGFVTQGQIIENTTTSQSFSNLAADRWYRVLVKNDVCEAVYSAVFQVKTTEIKAGTLTGPERVCEAANTGLLQLQNHLGNILRWEWSHDDFQNNLQTIAHTEAAFTFTALTANTWFRAVVGSPECGEQATASFLVAYDLLSLGGSLSGTASVCSGLNKGSLSLEGFRGQVLRWEASADDFNQDVQLIENTGSTHTFENLSAATWFRAVVQNGSCAAVYSTSYQVKVSSLNGGTLNGPTAVCQTSNKGSILLQGYVGTIVRWEMSSDNFASVQTIANTTDTYVFENLTTDTRFRVLLSDVNCGEAYSSIWQVTVDLPSIGGEVTGSQTFCAVQNSGALQLINHRGTVVRWEASTDNFIADIQLINHTETSYSYLNIDRTTAFRALVQQASCEAVYSAVATIAIGTATQAGAVSGAATVCHGDNSGQLLLQNSVGEVLRWESSSDGFATITTIDHTSQELLYQNLSESTAYRAVVQNQSCPPAFSQPALITVSPAFEAGRVVADHTVAEGVNGGELLLEAYSGQVLYWESSTDNFATQITRIANTTATLAYQDLQQTSWYRAVVQQGDCPVKYAVPARIYVNHAPLALADTLLVTEKYFTASLSVLLNDYDPDGDVLNVLPAEGFTAAGGIMRIDAQGVLYYEPPQEFYGTDALRYTVCDLVTDAPLCAEASIVLDLSLPIVVYQGVSPNGDGDNDTWFIGFIDRYPDNLVQLYDRYGALVYEQRAYDNLNKSFTGRANKGLRPAGEELPDGTYYYKIITSTKAPLLQGYIVLKK